MSAAETPSAERGAKGEEGAWELWKSLPRAVSSVDDRLQAVSLVNDAEASPKASLTGVG